MLQKFNKLAIYLTSAITITSAYSSEYIVTNANETNKEQIYDIVSKFRFPSILSKFTQEEFRTKYQDQGYDLINTFRTKDAVVFLQKVHEFTMRSGNGSLNKVSVKLPSETPITSLDFAVVCWF